MLVLPTPLAPPSKRTCHAHLSVMPVCLTSRCGSRDIELHPNVGRNETEPLVEAMGVGAGAVCGELYHAAAARARSLDGPAHEMLSQPLAAVGPINPHCLDLGAG